jgi:hypothetical protein
MTHTVTEQGGDAPSRAKKGGASRTTDARADGSVDNQSTT